MENISFSLRIMHLTKKCQNPNMILGTLNSWFVKPQNSFWGLWISLGFFTLYSPLCYTHLLKPRDHARQLIKRTHQLKGPKYWLGTKLAHKALQKYLGHKYLFFKILPMCSPLSYGLVLNNYQITYAQLLTNFRDTKASVINDDWLSESLEGFEH